MNARGNRDFSSFANGNWLSQTCFTLYLLRAKQRLADRKEPSHQQWWIASLFLVNDEHQEKIPSVSRTSTDYFFSFLQLPGVANYQDDQSARWKVTNFIDPQAPLNEAVSDWWQKVSRPIEGPPFCTRISSFTPGTPYQVENSSRL